MAFIGNTNTTQAFTPAIDFFSGNGSTTAFTLSRPVASVAQVQVTIDNVAQNPSSAYTVSSNTITFTSAPLSGTNNIYVYYTSPITQVIAPGQSTVGLTAFTATGTPSASTYLRGDNSWASVTAGDVVGPASATANGIALFNSTTGKLIKDSAASDGLIYGLTVGRGAGAVASNTAVGASALAANTSGVNSTAIGYQALKSNTSGFSHTAVGYGALSTTVTGIGSTAVGQNAGAANTSGVVEAFGVSALTSNTTGVANQAFGSGGDGLNAPLQLNTTGSNNQAYGRGALGSNTTGSSNVALGSAALYSNTTASNNTAVGFQAAYSTTTDDSITAIGWRALYNNTTGSGSSANVAVGKEAMYNNATGYYSIGIGYRALYNMNATGSNTAVGYTAGQNTTSGSGNTFIGYQTGKVCTTGSANIHLGYGTSTSATGAANEIVISTNSDTGKGNQTGFIAPGFGSCYQGSNSSSWATTSDRRLKKNITDNTEGLDKIVQIRVRNFEYRLPEEVDAELKPTDAVQKSGVQLGVIAQELQEVCSDCIKEESTGVLRVDSDNVFWHMVNAIKDLKALNDTQAATITALTARITALENK